MKSFRLFMIAILLFTFYFLLSSCSGSSCTKVETNIPQDIFESGNNFIISKTGNDFFNKYITPDFSKSVEVPSGYFLAYKLSMTEKPFVNGSIRFTVDSSGNVLTEKEISGIPDCILSPENCEFNIDEQQAINIAKENNLEVGIKEWRNSFMWSSDYNKYVWQILSTLKESIGDFGYRGNGSEIIIDPNSGEVLSKKDWRIN